MSNKRYLRVYLLSLAVLILLSAYPLINGARMAYLSFQNGAIEPEQYAKYVVPYAAICVSVVLFAAFQPLLMKLRRLAFPVGTLAAFGVFFAVEIFIERIQIHTTGMTLIDAAAMTADVASGPATVDIWQAALCVASPAMRGQALTYASTDRFYYAIGSDAYKLHYYMISLILIAMVSGLVYGACRAARDGGGKKPLILRGISTAALVALCVFANTTAFFREAAQIQTLLASALTCLFFIVLGASTGVYAGSYLTGRKWLVELGTPVLVSIVATTLMYIGEAVMMQGSLYRFGTGWFFEGMPGIALAPADVLVVLLSGAVTWLIIGMARRCGQWPGKWTAVIGTVLCAGVAVSGVALSAPTPVDGDVLGCYEYADCVYMNPLSSFAAVGKLPYVYGLTEDALIIADTETGYVERLSAVHAKAPVAEDEFSSKSEMSLWLPDLSAYMERYLLAVLSADSGEKYGLYRMDGEIWLVALGSVGVWSIYRLEKTDATTTADLERALNEWEAGGAHVEEGIHRVEGVLVPRVSIPLPSGPPRPGR